jgi:Asp-tRNA(Asn)/Glu-tRNA(Gln) amidotransferase C subunit
MCLKFVCFLKISFSSLNSSRPLSGIDGYMMKRFRKRSNHFHHSNKSLKSMRSCLFLRHNPWDGRVQSPSDDRRGRHWPRRFSAPLREIAFDVQDPPPPGETVQDSDCFRLERQKELILLETLPLGDESLVGRPLCQLLERSAQNHQKILEHVEKLAVVLGNSADFVTGCWEATTAARQAEVLRSDLDARFEFLHDLKGNLTSSIQHFFQMPETS